MTNIETEEPLYIADGTPLYARDFTTALKHVGITKGDIVLVHSDISVFGKLCTFNREFLFSNLLNELKNIVTEEGLIIMPTFSYSFCENRVFDRDQTKSKVGVLTEYFREQPDVVRTVHPIFSFAIWGENKSSFLQISKDSFDKNSIFGKLHEQKGKILFLGAPFQSCTFIHYIEQMYGVPYRYMKKFSGIIKTKDFDYSDNYSYFVRDLEKKKNELDLSRLEKFLLQNNILKSVFIGNGRVLLINSEQLYLETWDLLDKDIEFLLKE